MGSFRSMTKASLRHDLLPTPFKLEPWFVRRPWRRNAIRNLASAQETNARTGPYPMPFPTTHMKGQMNRHTGRMPTQSWGNQKEKGHRSPLLWTLQLSGSQTFSSESPGAFRQQPCSTELDSLAAESRNQCFSNKFPK